MQMREKSRRFLADPSVPGGHADSFTTSISSPCGQHPCGKNRSATPIPQLLTGMILSSILRATLPLASLVIQPTPALP